MSFGVACDDGDSKPAEEQTLAACAFESFSVELTAGPSASLTLEGTLYLASAASGYEGELRGMFESGDRQYAVRSSYSEDGDISVSVALGDGGHVVGLGRVAKLCESGAMIEGVAVGPTVSATNTIEGTDVGHWLLFSGEPKVLTYYLDPDFEEGTTTNVVIIKIPTTEVCTNNVSTKASCYENFCQSQLAGHYTNDPATGAAVCVSN